MCIKIKEGNQCRLNVTYEPSGSSAGESIIPPAQCNHMVLDVLWKMTFTRNSQPLQPELSPQTVSHKKEAVCKLSSGHLWWITARNMVDIFCAQISPSLICFWERNLMPGMPAYVKSKKNQPDSSHYLWWFTAAWFHRWCVCVYVCLTGLPAVQICLLLNKYVALFKKRRIRHTDC